MTGPGFLGFVVSAVSLAWMAARVADKGAAVAVALMTAVLPARPVAALAGPAVVEAPKPLASRCATAGRRSPW